MEEQNQQRPSQPRRIPDPLTSILEHAMQRAERRRDRIRAEIEANRRGEYVVPTWVLVLALVAMVGGLAALILL